MQPQNIKYLFVFDFDHTIVDGNTDTIFYSLFPNKKIPQWLQKQFNQNDWNTFMQKVFKYSHRQLHISPHAILQTVSNINLTNGFSQLFDYLKQKKDIYQCIIASDSNQLFIQSIIKKKEYKQLFKSIFTNPCKIVLQDKQQTEQKEYLQIKPYELGHGCGNCRPNMCKTKIIRDYLEKGKKNYRRIFYAGDGSNDYCPVQNYNTFTFCRSKYVLQSKIKKNMKIENFVSWEGGAQILQTLKKIQQKDKN